MGLQRTKTGVLNDIVKLLGKLWHEIKDVALDKLGVNVSGNRELGGRRDR